MKIHKLHICTFFCLKSPFWPLYNAYIKRTKKEKENVGSSISVLEESAK